MSASDRQGSNFESCVWRTVSSYLFHHPQEILLAQFSLHVHQGGLKSDSFHFISRYVFLPTSQFSEPSSGWRRSKLAELTLHGSPRTSDDLLQIIRNPDKFYRNATPPDFWATDVVGQLKLGCKKIVFY